MEVLNRSNTSSRRGPSDVTPTITVSKGGVIIINRPATELLGLSPGDKVEFSWEILDKDKGEDRAYKQHYIYKSDSPDGYKLRETDKNARLGFNSVGLAEILIPKLKELGKTQHLIVSEASKWLDGIKYYPVMIPKT